MKEDDKCKVRKPVYIGISLKLIRKNDNEHRIMPLLLRTEATGHISAN